MSYFERLQRTMRVIPPEEYKRRKFGLHFHFWNLASALVIPLFMYVQLGKVEVKINKIRDKRDAEASDAIQALVQGDPRSSEALAKLDKDKKAQVLSESFDKRLARLEKSLVRSELAPLRIFNLAQAIAAEQRQPPPQRGPEAQTVVEQSRGDSTLLQKSPPGAGPKAVTGIDGPDTERLAAEQARGWMPAPTWDTFSRVVMAIYRGSEPSKP